MNFHDRLRDSARSAGHILCLGIDPDLERLSMSYSQFYTYVNQLLEAVQPAAIKPNAAYFEVLGSTGWLWLEQLVRRWRGKCPIILDVKRGDIGPSSRAYARSAFERLGVDAVTVNPWMGRPGSPHQAASTAPLQSGSLIAGRAEAARATQPARTRRTRIRGSEGGSRESRPA